MAACKHYPWSNRAGEEYREPTTKKRDGRRVISVEASGTFNVEVGVILRAAIGGLVDAVFMTSESFR